MLTFAYDVDLVRACIGHIDQSMPCLGAEMRHVDDRGRIVGRNMQCIAHSQASEPLARLENRERAQQPECVEFMFHGISLAQIFAQVNTAVVIRRRVAALYLGINCGQEHWAEGLFLPKIFARV